MADASIERRLDGVLLLLTLTVSLLSGLVFGRDYGGEAFYAVVTFGVLGVIVLVLGIVPTFKTGRS